jgi:hypothetical protein
MELNNSKEIPIEKKQSSENKNKFQILMAGGVKKRTNSERKSSQDRPDISSSTSRTQINTKATYLNSLLKKSFFNTINKSNESPFFHSKKSNDILLDENSNSKLYYPKERPKNFLPPYLFDSINVNKNKKLTRQTKNELRDILDLYDKQKNNMKKYENDLNEAKEDLKKAKEARKKIMEEVYEIKKEIDNFNNNENNFNNQLNRSRLSLQVNNINDLFKSLNQGQIPDLNKENENKKNELEKEIKEYEEKISQLKFKNRVFMEDYDILLNDYKKNLNKNLKLNNCIIDIDKKTKEALKEKEDLKKYINKMGKI